MSVSRAGVRWTLAATVLGSALGFIDFGAVGVLLPVIQRDFATDLAALQWVVGATTLFLSSLLLVGGALGDRYGRRRVYMIGVALFTLAALAAGFAPTIRLLLAARAVQGVGAALLVPGSLALIAANVPERDRGRAYGAWAAMSGLVSAGAPFLAGYLADTLTWRALFWAYAPLGALVLLLLAKVPESRAEGAHRLDLRGALLATLGLGGVAYGFIESNRGGFGQWPVWVGLVGGALALVALVWTERRVEQPMLPLSMFRSRRFSGANLATLLVYAALSGALFFVPYNLIQLQGYAPTWAGAASAPFALLLTVLSPVSGWLSDRTGPRRLMIAGCLVAALAFVAFARVGIGGSYWTTFFPAYVLLGVGMALLIAPLTATVMSSAPQGRAGVASGVNNAVSRTAGLLAVAVFGVVAFQAFAATLPVDVTTLLGDSVRELAAAQAPADATAQDAARVSAEVDAAFLRAFRILMGLSAALCAAGAAVVAATVRSTPAD